MVQLWYSNPSLSFAIAKRFFAAAIENHRFCAQCHHCLVTISKYQPGREDFIMGRAAKQERKTTETEISVTIDLDGEGKSDCDTGIPFLDHMLTLFSRHGFFDLTVKADGDLEVDQHHTMEDIGIVMGQTIREALGDKQGIQRYGFFLAPMDDALARVVLDLSGRPYLSYNVDCLVSHINGIDVRLFNEFFQALAIHLGANLHIDLIRGQETHHILEAVFKAFARALGQAVSTDPRESGVPSTKGSLD